MFKVEIYKEGVTAFGSSFNTEKEAEEWAENHSSGIKDYKIIDLDSDEKTRATKIKALVKKRDEMLCATDWIFLPDVKFDQKHRKMYMTYRQLLRDVPQRLKPKGSISFESFEHWLRRLHPEEFMDGGKGQQIIYRFNYYLKEK